MINAKPQHNLGDIVYWDGSKLAYTPYTAWTNSLGTALGVCFIPTSHATAWGDGKARFLSVKGVNQDGTASDSNQSMYWDNRNRDAGLTKYTKVPTWDNTIGGSVGSDYYGFISSDIFTGATNVIDNVSYYEDNNPYIPSPYASDCSFYADYIRTISGTNVLSDFNGKANSVTIVDALGVNGGEAAKACSLYSTNGIPAGEWYLPAMGELGYIIPRFNVINSALTVCNGVILSSNNFYWSSTEFDSNNAYVVGIRFCGYIGGSDYKNDIRYVRPVVSLS